MIIYIKGGINLFYIIFGLLLCSLIVAVLLQSKEDEKWLWLKIIVIYLCNIVLFYFQAIKIPILIIIAYFVIKKKSKSNIRIKWMALIFSLISFIAINYIVPQSSLKQVYNFGKQVALENRFNKIDSSCYYPEDAPIQSRISRYNKDDVQDNVHVMFSVWVYDYNNIAIKDYEWLCYDSNKELDVYWSVNYYKEKDYSEAYIRFNKTGQEYLGIFKKDKNGKQYLESVVEGMLRIDGRPRSIFNMY